jgi:hypothetical protein
VFFGACGTPPFGRWTVLSLFPKKHFRKLAKKQMLLLGELLTNQKRGHPKASSFEI